MRITAVTCVKNEGPFVLEWIAYNRLIGVTDHLVYSNDCNDGTDDLLDALAGAGLCQHLPNPARGRAYQMEALRHAARQDIVSRADWVWVADVDEFLNIHAGDHTIPALIAACGAPHAISLHFRFFANAGIDRFEDRPVIAQFTRTHTPDLFCSSHAIEVKTLVRNDFPLHYRGAHRPFFKGSPPQGLRWSDGSGRRVPQAFLHADRQDRIRQFPARGARRYATLNHYALRSRDSYLVKHARGDVNREHRAFDTTYWRKRNDPACAETSILRWLAPLEREVAALKRLPGVAARHAASVCAHRDRIAQLRAQPGGRDQEAALAAAPPICAEEAALIATLGPPVALPA